MALACVVRDIAWTRVHVALTVEFSATDQGSSPRTADVHFVVKDGSKSLRVPHTPVGHDRYRLDINITLFHGRRQIPNGTWRVVAITNDRRSAPAGYDVTRLDELDAASRVFLYDQNRTAMTVSFGISENETHPDFLMRTYQMFRRLPKASPKGLTATIRAKTVNRKNKVRLANKIYRICRHTPAPESPRILFASAVRPRLEGNLLRIRDRMVERGLHRHFRFAYSFQSPTNGSPWKTLRTIFLLARSDIILLDDYFGILESLTIDKATRIIQVWHAGVGFKAIGFSRFGKFGSPKLQNAHRRYTYAITGSEHLVPVYAEAFGIEESAVVPTGLPRIDSFLDKENAARVVTRFYRKNPALQGKRIILFAPTFRGRGAKDAHYDYGRIDFDALYETCGDDSVVLFRMHHFVPDPVPIPEKHADRFFDFTHYKNGNDLLHITDLLITDYSSIIYEFSLLNRPMLFFAYDKVTYSATRGFHRDYDDTAPGKVCETFDQLVSAIRQEDYETWKVARFRQENFDHVDTHSADRVIDQLILTTPERQPLDVGAAS